MTRIIEVAEPEWSRPQPQRFRPERGLGSMRPPDDPDDPFAG